MSESTSARAGALAQLAEEAARFTRTPPPTFAPSEVLPPERPIRAVHDVPAEVHDEATDGLPGYVPVAVAPERGNTRPVVPVDGRLHMRCATATLDALDAVVREWKTADPAGLRDLERATLVRVGLGLLLADVAMHGQDGAVGEAVRAALDPAVRHTAIAMPDPRRWLRDTAMPAPWPTHDAVEHRDADQADAAVFASPPAG